ncbi:1,2-phenylacetyl-CoA epoxidase subunit PaaC [Halobacteriaceae archaeon GCM10025711]
MAAQSLSGPDGLSDREREAVRELLFRLADDELVIGERYTEWQVRAPTLESDLALSNIAQDEFGHARLWYDLLEDFDATESDLIWERDAADFRHSTLAELPFAEGDWADPVVRSYLYDAAERLRLEALRESSYPRIVDRVGKVLREEEYHLEHAEKWVQRLAADDDGRERVQAAVERLFPYALTLFQPGEFEDDIVDLGVRTETLGDLREAWLDEVVPFLESVGVAVDDAQLPEQYDVHHLPDAELPDHVGRDGSHTDDWFDLHEEMTSTYRELGRTDTAHIMVDPDDV